MHPIIKNTGIKFGLILAGIQILFYIVAYAINLELLVNPFIGLAMMLIALTVFVLAIFQARKSLNDVIDFKGAFTTFFLTAVIGFGLTSLFNVLLFNVIDPELIGLVKEMSLDAAVQNMKKFGASAADINAMVEQMSANNPYSFSQQMKGFVFTLAISSIVGVILALILKRQPVYKD